MTELVNGTLLEDTRAGLLRIMDRLPFLEPTAIHAEAILGRMV